MIKQDDMARRDYELPKNNSNLMTTAMEYENDNMPINYVIDKKISKPDLIW